MERGLRLQGVIRFIILTLFFIVLPSLVLAYFGAASVKDIEKNKQIELSAQGSAAARMFIDRMTSDFSSVEERVLYVLESGRTPTGTLHKHQRVVLRFNPSLELIAPFAERVERVEDSELFFHPSLQSNQDEITPPNAISAEIELRKARKYLSEGDMDASKSVLSPILEQERNQYALGGGRLHLMAGLLYAKTLPNPGKELYLQRILDSILNHQWSLDDGIEGAIAIEALAMLRQLNETSREQARYDDLRGRIELRMEQLYWTRLWEEEWRDVLNDPRQTAKGSLFWTVSDNAIWAKTTWNGDV